MDEGSAFGSVAHCSHAYPTNIRPRVWLSGLVALVVFLRIALEILWGYCHGFQGRSPEAAAYRGALSLEQGFDLSWGRTPSRGVRSFLKELSCTRRRALPSVNQHPRGACT